MNPVDREALAWALRRRLGVALAVMLAVLLLLLLRSWYLQVLHHERYEALAKNNRARVVVQKPERGAIYDRYGRLLVTNTPSFALALVLDDVPDLEATVATVAALLDLDPKPMLARAKRERRNVPYLPVTIRENLTLREVSLIEWAHVAGVAVIGEAKRHYVFGQSASHLLGYVGEITEAQMADPRFAGVLPGTNVGQYGAEARYDESLRGVPGGRNLEVDAKGFEVRELARTPPVAGEDLYLTIDLDVQQAAEAALAGRAGSVVALDPRNGRVIALVSSPALDPEEVSRGVTSERWKAISTDPGRPLINRAVQGVYPPGSIFKIPVAAALLDTLGYQEGFYCSGEHPFKGRIYRDWKEEGHGRINLHDAIVQSCDVFFYNYGRRLGIDTIADYAGRFGFGRPTGIDLPGERAGLLPSSAWKKKARGEVWYPGETLSAAIGQGYVSATPVQVAAFMAAVGAKGARFVPGIRLGDWSQQDGRFLLDAPRPLPGVPLSAATYGILNDALKGVVSEAKGTGHAAQSPMAVVAGKTGTAQVVAIAAGVDRKKMDTAPPHLRDHAWFAAYAPADAPTIAVAVLVEHGGHGGGVAGPVARRVIEAYLKNAERNLSDDALVAALNKQHQAGGEM